MKRLALAFALALALATPAHAETLGVETAARGTDNTLTVQAGLLRDVTMLGVEYAHAFHPNFDIAASASIGIFTAQIAVLPRLRLQHGSWLVTVGAGPSLAYVDEDLFSTDPGRGVLLPTLVGEASVGYQTHSGLILSATGGATGVYWNHSGPENEGSVVLPSLGVGVGWTF